MVQTASSQMPRGRPRAFDRNVVVERAMHVFWSRGFHGTSLPDLLAATRLSRGSLYAAFGDKHTLFLCALDRYIDAALARLAIELDPDRDALRGVEAWLAGYVARSCGMRGKRGCLVVATAMEMAAHDAAVDHRITRFFRAMEASLAAALARAKASGAVAGRVDPATAARSLVCLVEGMRVVGKTGPDRALSQAVVRSVVEGLTR